MAEAAGAVSADAAEVSGVPCPPEAETAHGRAG